MVSCNNKNENKQHDSFNSCKANRGVLAERRIKEITKIDFGPRGDTLSTEYTKDDTLWRKEYKDIISRDNGLSLRKNHDGSEIYRFFQDGWFTGFTFVRIEKLDTAAKLVFQNVPPIQEMDTAIVKLDSIIIPLKKWIEFKSYIDTINFWHLPNIIMNRHGEEEFGEDGSWWYIEGYRNGKYHIIRRWSPIMVSNFYKCCYFLIELAGMEKKALIDSR